MLSVVLDHTCTFEEKRERHMEREREREKAFAALGECGCDAAFNAQSE